MRTAIIHDWLTGMRGGEKVLELVCKQFPDAPIYTLLHVPHSVSDTIESHTIKTSYLQKFPLAQTKYRHYLPLYPFFAETHKAKNVDLVISTSHAVAKNMVARRRGGRRPVHICYMHSPMRYIWDRFDDYFGPSRVGRLSSWFLFHPVAAVLRWYDRYTAKRVDVFVANSSFVAKRILKFYNRQSVVVHPPVDVEFFSSQERKPLNHYLVVSALVPYKRTEDAIDACHKLGKRLHIVGQGPEKESLIAFAKKSGADVIFKGSVSAEDLAHEYATAKALLFPGVEDFGIVPVEAIATGCPVIGLAEGGLLDSMTDKTALLYKEASSDGLLKAMKEFETGRREFQIEDLRKQANRFSAERFNAKFQSLIKRVVPAYALDS